MIKKTFVLIFITLLTFAGVNALPGDITSIENFSLKDVNGKTHSLTDYSKAKAIVIMFISTQCPVSNAYNTRMVKIHETYKNKNIIFLGINSNKAEFVKEIKSHSADNNFEFPVLKDEKNIIADKFAASFTPEIYILDPKFNIVYHGRIDDSRDESAVTSNDLSRALDEILQGKKISVSKTKAFGCTIKRI